MITAVVGIGTMGSAIAAKLLESGLSVRVWNRTTAKARVLEDRGALVAESPAVAARGADIVISSLRDDDAVRETVLGVDGILQDLGDGAVFCDTSTISPLCAAAIARAFQRAAKQFVHAPVLGSKKQVASGELLVFASGSESAVRSAMPVIELLGSRVWRFDEPGKAAALKLACNMLIAAMMCGLSQSMAFAARHGIDPQLFAEVIGSSALASKMYESKSAQILKGDWRANFVVDNLIKDLDLALGAGREAGIPLALNAVIREIFVAASGAGFADEDYSAVSKVFARTMGVELQGVQDES